MSLFAATSQLIFDYVDERGRGWGGKKQVGGGVVIISFIV